MAEKIISMWFVEIEEDNTWKDIDEGIEYDSLHINKYLGSINELWFPASDSLIEKIRDKKGQKIRLINIMITEDEVPKKMVYYIIRKWCIKDRKIYALEPRKNVQYEEEDM